MTATVRRSYADLVRAKEDLSDFDCYACHEKNKPPVLRYDANQQPDRAPGAFRHRHGARRATTGTTTASTATTKPTSTTLQPATAAP
jgi:hypothetical protein